MFLRDLCIVQFLAVLLASQSLLAQPNTKLQLRSIEIHVPTQAHIETPADIKYTREKNGPYRLYFNERTVFPLQIKITDLFGAHIDELIRDPSHWQKKMISDDIIKNKHPNPVSINNLPRLCPRALLVNEGNNLKLIYQGSLDALNDKPHMQLFDPDVTDNKAQRELISKIDQKNILNLKRIRLSYDNEDSTILDYKGPNPLTRKEELIYEGEGGFYANFHYAVIPYDARVLNLDRQELLNLAEGKLKFIGREDLLPATRVHSFLPGPYLSKDQIYQMCEWGDTMFQASTQEMSYENLILWDWDLAPTEKVMLIVWEGDEEDWLIADGLLDPYYLTDDVVGIFVIDKSKTRTPLVLKNPAGNFEVEVETTP